MKTIVLVILTLVFSLQAFSTEKVPYIPADTKTVSVSKVQTDLNLHQPQENEEMQPMGSCTLKVNTDSFVGSVTIHNVSIFECAIFKLINFLR